MYWNSFLSWNVTATSQSCQDANAVSNGNSLFPFPFPVLLFLWLGPWGAAKTCASAQPEEPIPEQGNACAHAVTPGSQGWFYSSTIWLTKGDVWHIVGKNKCWTYMLKVSISPVRLILSIRLVSTFSLSFSSNCWETKQATGRSGFQLEIILLENFCPAKVSFFKLHLWPNHIQNSSSDTGNLSFLASQTCWFARLSHGGSMCSKNESSKVKYVTLAWHATSASLTLWHLSC